MIKMAVRLLHYGLGYLSRREKLSISQRSSVNAPLMCSLPAVPQNGVTVSSGETKNTFSHH